MRTLALSGWGQPHDALDSIAPDATHFDYAKYGSAEAAIEALAGHDGHERVIGWSLGGQLAVRAVAMGKLRPKQLVLIATPFHFMRGEPETYRKFRDNYATVPERTLSKAWELIAHGDARGEHIRAALSRYEPREVLAKGWLAWLDTLAGYSCDALSFDGFPPTLLVHGDNDVVVRQEQSRRFVEKLPHARLEYFSGCGHAPHWHDAEKLKRLVSDV